MAPDLVPAHTRAQTAVATDNRHRPSFFPAYSDHAMRIKRVPKVHSRLRVSGDPVSNSQTGDEIVRQAREAFKSSQLNSRKFSGEMTAELMKRVLTDEGVPTSARDVFIRGVPIEINLVVRTWAKSRRTVFCTNPDRLLSPWRFEKQDRSWRR